MILYSVRALTSAYLIAKFNADFDVDATYTVSPSHCTCPSWPRRQSCKHQDILAKFISRDKVDSEWFFCRETDSWHNPLGLESMPRIETEEPAIAAPAGPSNAEIESLEPAYLNDPSLPLPEPATATFKRRI